MQKFSVKGNIIFTKDMDKFEIHDDSYLNIENGKIISISKENLFKEVVSYEGNLIIPGFTDTHLHAPQINNIGLGYDEELLSWLEKYTFPEEAKYKNKDFAKKSYSNFVNRLLENGTTSSVIFGTIHKDTTLLLAEMMEEKGLKAYIGKVNMNRNSPDFYIEETEESVEDTEEFIKALASFENIKPIITPRFVPSCTEVLMNKLGDLAEKYDLKIQSHLSESRSEIDWVKDLHPECKNYLDVYVKYSLARNNLNTVMAHCVWLTDEEKEVMKDKEILVSHCPYSNANLTSGIAPVRELISKGINVSLGSDVSGGSEMFMGRIISLAQMLSKMHYVHIDETQKPLTISELFYMATKGGGKFFGNVGSFEEGYSADFLVINDKSIQDINSRTSKERLERFLFTGDKSNISKVYVNGRRIR
ncbi:MAG: guanine deaminase [Candidatus Riflebacteria bacterium]|nr:guanine deaminase [Candidatus Riflebacteria bacterium]